MRYRVSLWILAVVIVWVAVAVGVTIWAIPVNAQPIGCGLGPPPPCTPHLSVEWVPSLMMGATAASIVIAVLIGVRSLIRRLI